MAKDLVTEQLPAKDEEGKHGEHETCWITVSEKQGIKGIYCIACKKIITYVFDKSKGWTMAKAKKWMKKYEKEVKTTIETCIKQGAHFKGIQDLLELDDENRRFVEAIEYD